MPKINLYLAIMLIIGLASSALTWGKPIEDLVFFLAFDEGKGDTVRDLSGFGNNGLIVGKQDWVEGKFKGGFHFDGKTHIEVKNAEPLTSLTHPMTVSAWLNLTHWEDGAIL